jgi:hypothetical protein
MGRGGSIDCRKHATVFRHFHAKAEEKPGSRLAVNSGGRHYGKCCVAIGQGAATEMKMTVVVLVLLAGLVVSGGVFLLVWDIPPPTQNVEKVLADDRFPR